MSTLVICTVLDPDDLRGAELSLACALSDELRYSSRIGGDILVAQTGAGATPAYVALGKLAGFSSDRTGATTAIITNLAPIPAPIPLRQGPAGPTAMFEIADETYQKILAQIAYPMDVEEGAAAFDMTLVDSQFLRQLRREQEDICSFSGVRSGNLEAVIIRPLEQGGTWHISSFILLEEAAGAEFRKFNWSIGPQFQLLINAHAVGQDGMETASPTGMLVMPPWMIERLDCAALDWHRAQFFDRLR
jgi:hypothetical protein